MALVLGGAASAFKPAGTRYRKDQVLSEMNLLGQPPCAVVLSRAPEASAEPGQSVLAGIRARGSISIGYLTDSLPFAFMNARGDLVGFDVELAHRLASELGVRLELVAVPRERMSSFVSSGRCDLLMSGVAVTTSRAAEMLFTTSYLDETLGLLVRDHDWERFVSWNAIGEQGAVIIGVPNFPYFVEQLRELAPRATLQPIATVEEVFERRTSLDALAFPGDEPLAIVVAHEQAQRFVEVRGGEQHFGRPRRRHRDARHQQVAPAAGHTNSSSRAGRAPARDGRRAPRPADARARCRSRPARRARS